MTVVTDDEVERPKLTVHLCEDGSVETRASYAGNDELERLVRPVLALASGLNIAAASDRDVLVAEIERLREALQHARGAIASLDDDDLGWSQPPHDEIEPWPLKDELLHMIDAALLPLGGG